MSIKEAHDEVDRIAAIFTLLPEAESIYAEWFRLVVTHSVSGMKAYDARLVAAMNVYGITSILTFNTEDFKRYPMIRSFFPQQVIAVSG